MIALLSRGLLASGLLFVGICLASAPAIATVGFVGGASYQIQDGMATLSADRIQNNGTQATGTLHLTLWMTATSNPYTTGYVAARASFSSFGGGGRLMPGYYYSDISVDAPYTPPPAGTYYVHMYVSESPILNTVLDVITFTNTVTIEGLPETIDFEGLVRYRISGNQAVLGADRIVNNTSRTTGTLYLSLWMTADSDPYTSGNLVARASLSEYENSGRLWSGYYYSNVSLSTDYSAPPPGTYYVHLYVSEYPDLNIAQDILTFSETVTVGGVSSSVDMQGARYRLTQDNEVTLFVDRIVNNTAETTDELFLNLRMTPSSGVTNTEHRAARISLSSANGTGRLAAGESLTDLEINTDYVAPPSGSYFVHIDLVDSEETLDTFRFSNVLTIQEDDHGNSPELATSIASTSNTDAWLEQGGDLDYFSVAITRPGSLIASTSGTTDTHGTLRDSDSNILTINDDGGNGLNFRIEEQLEAGTYFVSVRGYDHSTTGSYTLDLQFEPTPENPAVSRTSADNHFGDFNGDGKGDVLLRHTDGRWYYYPMDGSTVISDQAGESNLGTNTEYHLAGIGDFNGDGKDDVLLRREDGPWWLYPMNGKDFIEDQEGWTQLPIDLDLTVAGIGDFNGDDKDDVLLRHADGSWQYWPMDGLSVIGAQQGPANLTADLDYQVAGIGDFDGDEKDDVLLRHEDGSWYLYVMNGRRFALGSGPASLNSSLEYRVAGIADFNGDGNDDVLLRHRDGGWYYYAMDGRRPIKTAEGSVGILSDLSYSVAGIGDLNGDGKADVLLRHTDGSWFYQDLDGRRVGTDSGEVDLTTDLDWTLPIHGYPSQLAPGNVRGNVWVAQGQVLDSDTWDLNNPWQSNDSLDRAQWTLMPVSVAGFAHSASDILDIYRVSFPSSTRVSLFIAENEDADLDLYLAESDGTIIEQSLGVDNLEEIVTTRNGEHLIVVSAYSGGSNYSLVVSIDETANDVNSVSSDRGTWSRDGEFVPDQILVKPTPIHETSTGEVGTMKSIAREFGMEEESSSLSGFGVMRTRPDAVFEMATRTLQDAGLRFATDDLRQRAATLFLRKRLQADDSVDYAQPNYIYRASAIPNDPYYRRQWHYSEISLPQAWDITTGDEDVVIAVIDTGVLVDHPDLAPRLLRDAQNRIVGYDFISDPAIAGDGDGRDVDPNDVGDAAHAWQGSTFHGSHVAGTIGAATNNTIGVSGVTWGSRIMPIRVLGRGGGSTLDIIEAIRFAAGLANESGQIPSTTADVINLSLGTPNEFCFPRPENPAMEDAYASAINAGVVVITSAGNDGCYLPNPYTDVADGVISVGATDSDGRLAPYSNYGHILDVVAPGGSILTAQGGVYSVGADDLSESINYTYSSMQGTSMAAPHVAGVVGLMLSVNSDLTPADINQLIDGTHVDPAAAPITQDLGSPGHDHEFGFGLIDAYQAVRVARSIQGGGSGETDRPILSVSPRSLHFGTTADVLRARLSNIGIGSLNVESVASEESWLDVSLDEWPTLVVRVDRQGLQQGTFVGRIQINSTGGNLSLPVSVQVQTTVQEADIGTVYIGIIDPQSFELQALAIASSDYGYSYESTVIAPGNYYVVAGTDRDGDEYFCDPGEACGMWPLNEDPRILRVDGNRRLDFPVSIDLSARVTSESYESEMIGKTGFRIPTREELTAPTD